MCKFDVQLLRVKNLTIERCQSGLGTTFIVGMSIFVTFWSFIQIGITNTLQYQDLSDENHLGL